ATRRRRDPDIGRAGRFALLRRGGLALALKRASDGPLREQVRKRSCSSNTIAGEGGGRRSPAGTACLAGYNARERPIGPILADGARSPAVSSSTRRCSTALIRLLARIASPWMPSRRPSTSSATTRGPYM